MLERFPGRKILVVDDEIDLREPIAQEFESLGCVVFEAANGREAFDIVSKEKIDVVVSDIRMPGGDGIELLKRIRMIGIGCPVVMLITGFSDLSVEEAFDLGAEAVLAKPFDLDSLDQAVAKLLTPPAERWIHPPAQATAKRKINRQFSDFAQAVKEGELAIGSGGFFLNEKNIPARGESVDFDLSFARGEISKLAGRGTLRWSRTQNGNYPSGCGIEFDYLSDDARALVLQINQSPKHAPFIPRGELKTDSTKSV